MQARLERLMTHIGPEKTYLFDGYYRIRENNLGQIEIAYLKPDGCGTTSVNPQLTLELVEGKLIPVKLMDMGKSPNVFLKRDASNGDLLDRELQDLLKRFEVAIENKN